MGKDAKKQYTLRNVPKNLDQALKRIAHEREVSLNELLLLAIAEYVNSSRTYHDLDDLIGSWNADQEFDRALAAQEQIDKDLWR